MTPPNDGPSKSAEQTSPAPTDQAAERLLAGGLVAVPTETVYGLAGRTDDLNAIARIFEVKGRPRFDPLIVHVQTADAAEALVDLDALGELGRKVWRRLTDTFWPGPLTLVVPKNRDRVPDLVTAGLPTVALRAPAHPIAQAVLRTMSKSLGSPASFVAPSANRFGYLSSTEAAHVWAELGESIDLILDGGPMTIGVESTVLRIDSEEDPSTVGVYVLRPGAIASADLRSALQAAPAIQATVDVRSRRAKETVALESPGQLARHYAPQRPLVVLEAPLSVGTAVRAAIDAVPSQALPQRASSARCGGSIKQLQTSCLRNSLRGANRS